MNEDRRVPTAANAADFTFDGTQVVCIPQSGDGCAFETLEWGSDAHIAFLEQALKGLQEALADAKAARAQRQAG